jgi:serine protease AprX
VVGEHVVGEHLVGQHVVGEHLVGQLVVRQHLDGPELGVGLVGLIPMRRLTLSACAALVAAGVLAGAGWGAYDPSTDVNSMASTTAYTGAQAWWNAGYTGAGVDVALIDSGVSPVDALSAPGKVVYGPDLSLESQAPNLTDYDTYGHGTFMAGLIAGNGADYRGMAPDARIVSVKVATADGGTDVTQVIAAIDWVVQHAHDPGFNIRVINLSYGTNSTQAYGLDPLAYAAEQAWKHGIVVVAAAGNTGYQKGAGATGIADPAYDPYVIAAGASDSMGTATTSDDQVASFSASSQCKTCKIPDILAPGAHLQGLRDPNSWIDANHPEGYLDANYFRGSGTSQAAALVSGAVALVLQRYPNLTPDQVKRYFQQNGLRLSGTESAQGGGEMQLGVMLNVAPSTTYVQKLTAATGTGTIEGARGQDHVTQNGVTLSGEQDIFGQPIDTRKLASAEASASTWSGGTWNASTWSGSGWSGDKWAASTWSGNSWTGDKWSASTWSASTWSASTWSASTWSASTWSASTWSGNSWSGNTWTGQSWASDSWG